MQYKKKLTDIFLRKEEKQKKEIIAQKPKIVTFDESYFQAELECDNTNSTLMKVTAVVKKGPNAGQHIPLKCRWYSKSQFDFKQIDQVRTNFFQPCLQDVGSIICVQIQPQIEGMTYTGITIMKQSDQLRMDKRLEQMTSQYFLSKHLQMEGKVETMYSQDKRFQRFEFPVDVVVQLRLNSMVFIEKLTKQLIGEYTIDNQFPIIDFNRKSFNSILLTLSSHQSMKISLSNNFNRDLFALIVRSIPNRLSITVTSTEDQLPLMEVNSPALNRVKSEGPTEETTKLILKLDQVSKEVRLLKRANQQLTLNYHLQRTAKINLLNEVQKLKAQIQKITLQHQQCQPLHSKIKQVTQENNFYFGELALIKTQLKEKTNTIKELKYQLSQLKVQNQNLQEKLQQLQVVPKTRIKSLQEELLKVKSFQQQLESQNQVLKEKINELQNQKNLLKKKLTSIVSEKSLPNTFGIKSPKTISFEDLNPIKDSQTQIKELKMQITSLEMLLKHKKGEKGGDLISLHYLVNSLTQKITQKQTEIQSLKKINKEMSKNVSVFALADTKSVNH